MKKIILLFITFLVFQLDGYSKKLIDLTYWKTFYDCEYAITVSKQYEIPYNKLSELEKVYDCQIDLYYLLAISSIKTNHNTNQILIKASKEAGLTFSTIQDMEMFFPSGPILTDYIKSKKSIIDSMSTYASVYDKLFINHKMTPIIELLFENDQIINSLGIPDSINAQCLEKFNPTFKQLAFNINTLNFNHIKKNCLDKNGNIPSYTEIGFNNQAYISLILLHYAAIITNEEKQSFFNFIDKQLKLNRLFPAQYAVIMDKYYWVNNNTSIYSQLIVDNIKIIDLDKIDETRKKIGLNTLKEFYEINNLKLPQNYK